MFREMRVYMIMFSLPHANITKQKVEEKVTKGKVEKK